MHLAVGDFIVKTKKKCSCVTFNLWKSFMISLSGFLNQFKMIPNHTGRSMCIKISLMLRLVNAVVASSIHT